MLTRIVLVVLIFLICYHLSIVCRDYDGPCGGGGNLHLFWSSTPWTKLSMSIPSSSSYCWWHARQENCTSLPQCNGDKCPILPSSWLWRTTDWTTGLCRTPEGVGQLNGSTCTRLFVWSSQVIVDFFFFCSSEGNLLILQAERGGEEATHFVLENSHCSNLSMLSIFFFFLFLP